MFLGGMIVDRDCFYIMNTVVDACQADFVLFPAAERHRIVPSSQSATIPFSISAKASVMGDSDLIKCMSSWET